MIGLEQAAEVYLHYRRPGMDHGVVGAYERLAMRFGKTEVPSLDALERFLEGPPPPVTAYCAFCRSHFVVEKNPPYSVIHVNATADAEARHLHAETREELSPVS